MRLRSILSLCVVALMAFSSISLAGGDQNRGSKGQGKVHQNQHRN